MDRSLPVYDSSTFSNLAAMCLFLIPGHIKCTNKFEAHSTQFDCYVQCIAPNSDSSIPILLSKFYQNCNLILT
jgi:hypothetical protein